MSNSYADVKTGRNAAISRLITPELCRSHVPLNGERAREMPGAGRTHGLPAEKNAGSSHHRFSRNIRHSPRGGFNFYT
jgi:hypothetical protein